LAFPIGLLLTPAGAAIGSFLFFLAISLQSDGPPFSIVSFLQMIAFGTAIGMIPATPVSAIILPVAYHFLHRGGSPGPRKLAVVGAISGFVISGGLLLAFWIQGNQDKDFLFWAIIFGVGLDGAIAGAFCGTTLGFVMRRLRTGRWRLQPVETQA
jgi:hypothetical protein